MQQVTLDSLEQFVALYSATRGGEANEDTASEAMFVAVGKYAGVFLLSTGQGPMWIGVQNATSRMSSDGRGEAFSSVKSAIAQLLADSDPLRKVRVYYSVDAVERLRWLADRIAEFKTSGDFLLYA